MEMIVVSKFQDEHAPSVMHELMRIGQAHFDIFARITGLLDAETRRAVAGSCRSARALANAAVSMVQLSASSPPPERDLAEVFPNATVLELTLTENEEGEPCDSFSAAQRLQHWTAATPRLLSQLTTLSLYLNLATTMKTTPPIIGLGSAIRLIGRWVTHSSFSTARHVCGLSPFAPHTQPNVLHVHLAQHLKIQVMGLASDGAHLNCLTPTDSLIHAPG
jgi:hypothetical protein